MYDGPVIDAHHHLWDLAMGRHPWLAATAGELGGLGDLGPIRRNYLPADFLADAAGQTVVASVHVEAGWQEGDGLGETRWLDGLDKAGGVASRYVARVALADVGAAAQIEAQAANPRVAGIRDILSWTPDPARRFAPRGDLMADPAWRAGLARLQRHGLVFDLMLFPPQLAEAARLVADHPDQLFVLEHGGSPIDRDPEGMAVWRRGLAELARRPNVVIKISDLVAYDPHWTLESMRPVIGHCLDGFGPERTMFGSDFPVAGLHASYGEVVGTLRALTADLSRDEQRAVFHDTARRVYGVG
ncbi:amidohydrolase family protein [Labrys wisconsinensis]|uniref:TIM-barrel fold metal-dependent hydrolase n=1 Tax=Labrys wisconsinensis TaxID=425677 RepID=A0ABU0J0P1_9HYPH|nr:amidohydrolase family protein [Labrys wisconsinensis]MDQ0467824.1 putative TIM-barrel fold metal-dependent hydrolase [Labrys wisconsinensis]